MCQACPGCALANPTHSKSSKLVYNFPVEAPFVVMHFDAYAAGTVPIWRGLDRDDVFNKSAMLDLSGISVLESINILKSLSDNEITSMRNQPLLNSVPGIQPIVDAMRAVLLEKG